MESFKKIGYLLIALVYLFLSTGVALVKTNCVCADLTNVSIYDLSDAQDEIFADQHCCEETLPAGDNEKHNELNDCGCDIPVVTYFKLTHHAGSDTKLEYPTGKTICLVYTSDAIILDLENVSTEKEIVPYYPPPKKPYGRILISFINQRKIALTA